MKNSRIILTVLTWIIISIIVIFVLFFIFDFINAIVNKEWSSYNLKQEIGELIKILYIPLTLWLVFVTNKSTEISFNAQKANNKVEIQSYFFVNEEEPQINDLNSKNVYIKSGDVNTLYQSNLGGKYLYLVVHNVYGGGKATSLSINLISEAIQGENSFSLNRKMEESFLAPGDAYAFFIHRIGDLSKTFHYSIKSCEIRYSTPFDEVSQEPKILITFNETHPIEIKGDFKETFILKKGISEY
ncbi:hypothetical protein KAU33_10560 [Candidatus Dependentiae bacterium]|nr:hypothetical protein [Candidatus Dependentiae bacterium]